jgi:hypothetical protein
MNCEDAKELADYLNQLQKDLQTSIARDQPWMKAHIAKLALWEKMIRDLNEPSANN